MKTIELKAPTPYFLRTLMECPVCGNHPMHIYRCSSCGEVRCGSDQCIGSKGGQYKRWARSGTLCRHCGDAAYRLLVSDSEEMHHFLIEHRRTLKLRPPVYPPLRYEAA
ncbi:MAG: hypothetical protein HQL95_10235 [Magnetococcales bacterium]|nr:hypothetical protein [Magnetococcales bacterium]